ncbi:hypothetical protein ACHAXT_004257 [Thalassiosira profunda]
MPVFITNESDYLGPSQACVNPLFAPPPPLPAKPTQQSASVDRGSSSVANSNNGGSGGDGAPSSQAIGNGNGRAAAPVRRRIRPRRAVIKCEDDESSTKAPKSEPVRLANNDESSSNNAPQQTPAPTVHATTQTIKKAKKATVTLSDCLSCSGCVTSAEAVLVSHHSVDKLREVAGLYQSTGEHLHQRRIVFTVSPASLADLYRHLYLEAEAAEDASHHEMERTNECSAHSTEGKAPSRDEFLQLLTIFLQSEFGAEIVIDGAVPQRISLVEAALEFCHRYRQTRPADGEGKNGDAGGAHSQAAALPSIALSSTKTRYINKEPNGTVATNDDDALMEVTTLSHPPGRLLEEDGDANDRQGKEQNISLVQSNALPMLASSCPGFVCLVEKTAPAAVPLLSSAKSPMAVAGTLIKAGEDAPLEEIDSGGRRPAFHVAIMPCHDKKLEAGRGDFAWDRRALLQYGRGSGSDNKETKSKQLAGEAKEGEEDLVKEVDLVLTTGELLEVLGDAVSNPSEHIVSSVAAIRQLFDSYRSHCSFQPLAPIAARGANIDIPELDTAVHGSGSYADFIFRYAASDLFGCKLPEDKPLPWKSSSSAYSSTAAVAGKATGVIRRRRRRQETTDLREVTLYKHSDGSYSCDESAGSTAVLRFATAYGFKNVQLVLQSLSKTEQSSSNQFDYVEVMACPSGCSNGGGQVGAQGQREAPSETRERVKKTVSAVPILRPNKNCASLSSSLCGCNADGLVSDDLGQNEHFGANARRLFHTRFHVVPELELSTGATAGVAVKDTNW